MCNQKTGDQGSITGADVAWTELGEVIGIVWDALPHPAIVEREG